MRIPFTKSVNRMLGALAPGNYSVVMQFRGHFETFQNVASFWAMAHWENVIPVLFLFAFRSNATLLAFAHKMSFSQSLDERVGKAGIPWSENKKDNARHKPFSAHSSRMQISRIMLLKGKRIRRLRVRTAEIKLFATWSRTAIKIVSLHLQSFSAWVVRPLSTVDKVADFHRKT